MNHYKIASISKTGDQHLDLLHSISGYSCKYSSENFLGESIHDLITTNRNLEKQNKNMSIEIENYRDECTDLSEKLKALENSNSVMSLVLSTI